MKLDDLRELYIDELKDLYSAEKQLVKALPKMAKGASTERLQQAISDHLAQTEGHVERLETIFERHGVNPRGKKCVGMEGLIEEGKEMLESDADEAVVDAGIISKAQHVEHYEIAGYGTVRTWAQLLGESDDVADLERTLAEEKEADQLLTEIAESTVNAGAERGDFEPSSMSDSGDTERVVARSVESDRGQTSRSKRSPSRRRSSGARARG